jgi:hypothetical protein
VATERITYGPFTGGINRAVARDKLSPNDLYDAIGVFQGERGSLFGCFESNSNEVTFTDSAKTQTGQKKVPLRVIYWADDGAMWQLYSKDYQGNTSIRREGTDREYGSYAATGEICQGYLIICGNGQQTLAVHPDYSCNTSSVAIAASGASYDTTSGVVTVTTWSAGTGLNVIAGDYLVDGAGNRFAVSAGGTSSTTFTIATGQTVSFTTASYLERFRPLRLGSVYYPEDGTVSLSQGSRTVTMSDTSGIAANQYIMFSNATTFVRGALHGRSYKISSVDSATVITLEDAYEGTTDADASCRVATTSLKVALPFIYGGRLCAVGADSTANDGAGDYSTIYWSGYPGSTSNENDVFDFTYWDVENANYPVGINEGAIQRVIPQDRRMVVFLQNGLYAVRNTLPVDAALGHDLADGQLASGLGSTTYDSVCVGPDGQTIYFGSPDGLFRLYGNTVEPIDAKIRSHELYAYGIQYAAQCDSRVYFTDATEHPDNVQPERGSTVGNANLRNQTPTIWILDLLSNSFTCTQRIKATYSGGVKRIGCPGYEGGVFAPYRGDLTERERLLIGVPGGCVKLNDRDSLAYVGLENIDDNMTFHGATVITPTATLDSPMIKPRRAFAYGFGDDATSAAECQFYIGVTGEINTLNAIWRLPNPKQTYGPRMSDYSVRRYIGNFSGLPAMRSAGVGVGSIADSANTVATSIAPRASSRSATGTASVYYATPFTPSGDSGLNFLTVDRLDCLLKLTSTDNSNITLGIFNSSGTLLTSATAAVSFYGVQTDFYWLSAYLSSAYTLVSGTQYYFGVQIPANVNASLGITTFAPDGLYTISGGVASLVSADEGLGFRCVNELGLPAFLVSLERIELEALPLPGRKR